MQWGCFLNAFAFALFLSNSVPEQGKGLCGGQQATINCLKNNFRELYQKDYKQFWNILRSAEVKALRCHPISTTTEFLELTPKADGEVAEYFSEVLEKKFLPSNPQCFLDALVMADTESQKAIMRYLRYPIFSEEAKIREILSRYRSTKQYGEVLEPYFKQGKKN